MQPSIKVFLFADLPVIKLCNKFIQTDKYPELFSGHFEGDIIMNDKLRSLIHGRTGLIDTSYRWENGIVPYYINSLYFSK